ncbi:MAG: Ig-like domain-containing protein [Kineosporiaceae bacterium]|nr:Ig-like domain-containing protein [Aeromicrobium sp.]
MRRTVCLLAIALAAMALGISVTQLSSATFIAKSANTATIKATADWAPPVVSLVDPGSIVQGAVTISAAASDDRSGVANVLIEYAVADSNNWVSMCAADTTAPYSCPWNTGAVGDGFYDLRATATDVAGYTAISDIITTRVVNTANVILTSPGSNLRGIVPLQAKIYNAPASTPFSIEVKRSASSTWSTITGCTTSTSTTLNCSWNTLGLTDFYDLRVIATVGTTTYTDVAADIQVDNTPPTVAIASPASPLSGVVTLASTSADADAGVAKVQYAYAPNGTSSWTAACLATNVPYSCSFNTVALSDGTYSFRAISTDAAGNDSVASIVNNIVVNNTVASVSVVNPGSLVSGIVTVNVNANSSNGVSSVRLQRAVTGTSTYTDICSDSTSPYACTWDTKTVIDGNYDLRAVMTQVNGAVLTSAVVTTEVNNSPLRGVDVQTVNGGATSGKLQSADKINLTFGRQIDPATISAGWNGTAKTVTARIKDGLLVGGSSKADQFSVDSVNLGSVSLNGDFVKKSKNVALASTMTITTQLVNGVNRSVITITLNATPVSSDVPVAAAAAAAMSWSPSSSVKDLNGATCSTAIVTESGSLDKDF